MPQLSLRLEDREVTAHDGSRDNIIDAFAEGGKGMARDVKGEYKRPAWWLLLLVIPFIGTLWLPFYAHFTPTLWGLPFFYWYQFLWVIITVAITAFVYWLVD
jgi:hypothetical protein